MIHCSKCNMDSDAILAAGKGKRLPGATYRDGYNSAVDDLMKFGKDHNWEVVSRVNAAMVRLTGHSKPVTFVYLTPVDAVRADVDPKDNSGTLKTVKYTAGL